MQGGIRGLLQKSKDKDRARSGEKQRQSSALNRGGSGGGRRGLPPVR